MLVAEGTGMRTPAGLVSTLAHVPAMRATYTGTAAPVGTVTQTPPPMLDTICVPAVEEVTETDCTDSAARAELVANNRRARVKVNLMLYSFFGGRSVLWTRLLTPPPGRAGSSVKPARFCFFVAPSVWQVGQLAGSY